MYTFNSLKRKYTSITFFILFFINLGVHLIVLQKSYRSELDMELINIRNQASQMNENISNRYQDKLISTIKILYFFSNLYSEGVEDVNKSFSAFLKDHPEYESGFITDLNFNFIAGMTHEDYSITPMKDLPKLFSDYIDRGLFQPTPKFLNIYQTEVLEERKIYISLMKKNLIYTVSFDLYDLLKTLKNEILFSDTINNILIKRDGGFWLISDDFLNYFSDLTLYHSLIKNVHQINVSNPWLDEDISFTTSLDIVSHLKTKVFRKLLMKNVLTFLLYTLAIFLISHIVGIFFKRVRLENLRDPLTGVYSRKVFLYISTHLNKRDEFTLCYIDLNNLKEINDTYGHDEGDKYIKAMASSIKSSIRKTDIVIRMGGDEFLLISPLDVEVFQGILTRITHNALASRITFSLKKTLEFSYGFASTKDCDFNCALKIADERMYKMKSSMKKSNTPPTN